MATYEIETLLGTKTHQAALDHVAEAVRDWKREAVGSDLYGDHPTDADAATDMLGVGVRRHWSAPEGVDAEAYFTLVEYELGGIARTK